MRLKRCRITAIVFIIFGMVTLITAGSASADEKEKSNEFEKEKIVIEFDEAEADGCEEDYDIPLIVPGFGDYRDQLQSKGGKSTIILKAGASGRFMKTIEKEHESYNYAYLEASADSPCIKIDISWIDPVSFGSGKSSLHYSINAGFFKSFLSSNAEFVYSYTLYDPIMGEYHGWGQAEGDSDLWGMYTSLGIVYDLTKNFYISMSAGMSYYKIEISIEDDYNWLVEEMHDESYIDAYADIAIGYKFNLSKNSFIGIEAGAWWLAENSDRGIPGPVLQITAGYGF